MNAIYSMTGYAAVNKDFAWGSLTIDLKTVNHRFLEMSWRGPEELRHLEPVMREAIGNRISRGKIECRINLNLKDVQASAEPNPELLEKLAHWQAEVLKLHHSAPLLSVAECLSWPGMFQRPSLNGEELAQITLSLLEEAIQDLCASRAREGDRLRELLTQHSQEIERIRQEVSPTIPLLVKQYQDKLAAKLSEALGRDDEDRVRQEVVMYASRIDVEEEIARLGVHVTELIRILKKGGAVGKRLDFLMQELHREANTLGSKSVASSTSAASLELKVLIEQMREQVQNLE